MNVNLRCLNRAVSQNLLNQTKIMRPFVKLACITVPDFVWCDSGRNVSFAYPSDCSRCDIPYPSFGSAVQMGPSHGQCIHITEHGSDFASLASDADGLIIVTDVLVSQCGGL